MSMLAEKRKKTKWCLNPNGKVWSNDNNKFGQRMLEKMGWKKGCGLGVNLQGMKEHVKVSAKNDNKGLGSSKTADELIHHQENFETLLSELHSTLGDGSSTPVVNTVPASLEEKSKNSRARVHYQKFTRGKDVSRYSASDMAGIFGKKTTSQENKTFQMGVYEDHYINNSETDPGCKSPSSVYSEYSKNIVEKPFSFNSDSCKSENGEADVSVDNLSVKYGYKTNNTSDYSEDIDSRSESQTSAQKLKARSSAVVDISDILRCGGEQTIVVSPRTQLDLNISEQKDYTPVLEDYAEIAKTHIFSSEKFFLCKEYYTVYITEPKKKSIEVVDLTDDFKSTVKENNSVSRRTKLDLDEKKKKSIEIVDLSDDLKSGVEDTYAVSHRSKLDKNSLRRKVKDKAVLENYEKNASKADIPSREIHVGVTDSDNLEMSEEGNECLIIEELNECVENPVHKKINKEKIKKGKQEKLVQINMKRKVQSCDVDQLEINSNCAESNLDADVTQCNQKIKKKKTENYKKGKEVKLKVKQMEDEIVESFKTFHISKKNNLHPQVTHNKYSDGIDSINEPNKEEIKPKRKKLNQTYESPHLDFKAEDPDMVDRRAKKTKKCSRSFCGASALQGSKSLSSEPLSEHTVPKENRDNTLKSTRNKSFSSTKPVLITKVGSNVVKDKKSPKKEERSLKDAVKMSFKGSNLHLIAGYGCS